jgi:hypothetical protein
VSGDKLTRGERLRLARCPVKCPKLQVRIENLADFVALVSAPGLFWYRGNADMTHRLVPSALRYESDDERTSALRLVAEFRRVGEIRLQRPPRWDEEFRWVQLAQHYGVPTRLLDWTESPTVALYFACQEETIDGAVFVMNPIDLNRASFPLRPRILDQDQDAKTISKYLVLTGTSQSKPTLKTIAINPVWNSERILAQRGVFTLHGSDYELDADQAPSLVALPIFREAKPKLRSELERIGSEEMTLFPELEHACRYLKRRAGLK